VGLGGAERKHGPERGAITAVPRGSLGVAEHTCDDRRLVPSGMRPAISLLTVPLYSLTCSMVSQESVGSYSAAARGVTASDIDDHEGRLVLISGSLILGRGEATLWRGGSYRFGRSHSEVARIRTNSTNMAGGF
jgi:hypothetical protein